MMAKRISPFVRIDPEMPFEQRMEAFNTLGESMNLLHECMDAGFNSVNGRIDDVSETIAGELERNKNFRETNVTNQEALMAALRITPAVAATNAEPNPKPKGRTLATVSFRTALQFGTAFAAFVVAAPLLTKLAVAVVKALGAVLLK